MRKKFKELLDEEIIVKLPEAEKESYCSFLTFTWQDNFKACRFNLKKFPRWSIIAGYYAMHDLAKLFLAKNFGLKITKRVHYATIVALEEVFKEKELREKVVKLLKEAERYYAVIERPIYLRIARRERERAQYYTGKKVEFKNYQSKSFYFFNQIVKPFIQILRKLI
jgi:hypothetical protein